MNNMPNCPICAAAYDPETGGCEHRGPRGCGPIGAVASSIAHHSDELPPSISTHTGLLFNYYAPEVNLTDVAHGLSNTCRFSGQTDRYYSVAEHSILVAAIVFNQTSDHFLALAALWHDAHEAYVGDIPTPLKRVLGGEYRIITNRIDDEVGVYLGIHPDLLHNPDVKNADRLAMLYEASILQPRSDAWAFTHNLAHDEARSSFGDLPCFLPVAAENCFIQTHMFLTERCSNVE